MSKNLASHSVLMENNVFKITKWEFLPSQETGWHTHHMDYIVLPLVNGQLKIISEDFSSNIVDVYTDKPYFKKAGVYHNVISHNENYFSFIEMEFKQSQNVK